MFGCTDEYRLVEMFFNYSLTFKQEQKQSLSVLSSVDKLDVTDTCVAYFFFTAAVGYALVFLCRNRYY